MKVGLFHYLSTAYAIDPAILAKRAEELGFDSLWLPEHPIMPVTTVTPFPLGGPIPAFYADLIDPFVGLARASAVTKTIKLGTGICLVPERNPLLLAKEIATLDHFSGGRFLFGIGAGWLKEETEIMGGDFAHRWTQTQEAIMAMQALWTQEEAAYHGRYYPYSATYELTPFPGPLTLLVNLQQPKGASGMLPVCRTPDDVHAIPPFEVTCEDVEGFLDELGEFHALFRDCFVRREPREHFFRYMVGQFSSLERKSIEPIAIQTEASSIRAMQRSLSDTQWNDARMLQTYHQQVAKEMGAPDGVIIVDESGFVKKGQDSVGVARQYCGTLGKVDNCQVGVFAAYASRQGYALVDKRLFLPEPWFSDAYANRRAQCDVPKEAVLHTKPQLAAALVQCLYEGGTLPFRYIAADCLYGNSPEFWAACEACVGTVAFVAVPEETRCWLAPVATTTQSSTYKGKHRTQRVVTTPETPLQSVAKLAQQIGPRAWYRRTVSEGTKGPIVSPVKVMISH